MSRSSKLIYSSEYTSYYFHQEHPFNQKRLLLMYDLIQAFGLVDAGQVVSPRFATDEEIALIHDPSYIRFIHKQGESPEELPEALHYGVGTEDVPFFPHMHEAAALVVGGSLQAVEEVMNGRAVHAFNPAGGLHHAFRGRASGFCVYNDCAIAIAYLRKYWDARILYIDTDAHHGDGVQWAFYEDPNVLTVSIHETGKYLFPGTGNTTERGEGAGYGFSVNVPLDAFTEDDSYLEVYRTLIPRLAKAFRPDVIVTQNGCDAHAYDPLTHLSCSMRIYREIPRLAHELAHEWADGRWIALGGGGYDIWRVVPRAWTLLWAEMTDRPLADEPIPQSWLDRWQPESEVPLPAHMSDHPSSLPVIPRRAEISEKNRVMLERALLHAPS